MDAMLQNDHEYTFALELGKLLDEHRGGEVIVMDMRSLNFWTDFFVIATVTSNTHLAGLERHIKDFTREKGLEIRGIPFRRRLRRSEANADSSSTEQEEWRLLDLGAIVIHLMTSRLRSFYELERLWSAAPRIFQSAAPPAEPKQSGPENPGSGVSRSHSSKSS